MADNVILNSPTTVGATIATDDVAGVQHQLIKIEFGADGVATPVTAAAPLPVTDAAAEASLASIDSKLTNPLPVSGNFYQATQPVSGTVGVSSLPAGLATSALQQTDALTDTELRATPIPVSGTVTVDTSLLSTGAKQDSQTALLTTLNSLIETNNYLVQFLSQLTGAMNAGAPALRTTPIASVSTAVTGTLTAVTTVGTITNFGTAIPAKEMADDINNFTVTLANINNVTA